MAFKRWLSRWRKRQFERQIIAGSGLFDASFYSRKYPDVSLAGLDPFDHFLNYGRFAQRSPCAAFDTAFYLGNNPDVSRSSIDPLVHYILYGRREGRAAHRPDPPHNRTVAETVLDSGLFDPEFYRTLYPDVAASGTDPFEHYLSTGRSEHRLPSADFDPAVYLAARPDVRQAGVDPLIHYLNLGQHEGRYVLHKGLGTSELAEASRLVKRSGLFDSEYYLRQCPAVRDACGDPVLHYLISGFAPFIQPSPAFAAIRSERAASTLAAIELNPLLCVLQSQPATSLSHLQPSDTLQCEDAIQYEIKAGETYFRRFRFTEDGLDSAPQYALDAIADLVCQAPLLSIDRMCPDASIIIPFFGQLPYVLNCLDSLRRHRSRWTVEILLADDASDESPVIQYLEAIPWIRYLRRPHNSGFIRNCNDAARLARGRHLVFLNSDTRVVRGWLDELAEAFELFPQAGLIGSSLCSADGLLQEAGGIYWSDGSAWNYGRGDDPLHPKYCFARQVDYVSGASIAVPAPIWQSLGGFDTAYSPAYCEDADFAFRLRLAGYQVWLQPLSRVIHFEGKTHGRDLTKGVKRYQSLNMRLFAERWRDILADHGENGRDPDKAANRTARDRLLVIDANTPRPDQDSGSFITFRMLLMLQDLGYQVTFVPEHSYLHDRTYTAALQRRGIECLYRPHFRDIEDVLNFRDDFDVVVAYRHNVLGPIYAKLRQRLSSARLIFHNVDLHFLREEREANLYASRSKKIKAAMTRATELELIAKADCTIVHTHDEAQLIRKHLPAANLVEFRYVSELHYSDASFESRSDIMFLGGFRHPPNVDAVTHFVTTVWPRLLHRLPEHARFCIVGPDPPTEVRRLVGPRVIVTGFVSDLKPYFDRTRVFVAPLRYGAGIKGKVIQSLSYGAPAVISGLAAEGIGLVPGTHALVVENESEFADTVASLYSDKVLWHSLQAAGYQFVNTNFSRNIGLQLLRQILDLADTTWLARQDRALYDRLNHATQITPIDNGVPTTQSNNLWVPAGHFYSPLVDPRDPQVCAALDRFGRAELPAQSGLFIDEPRMLDLYRELSWHYENLPFSSEKQLSSLYFYDNPTFSYGDAIILGLIILSFRPRQILEVGSGFSSAAMIDINEKVLGRQIQFTFVDPFPESLLNLLPIDSGYRDQVIQKPVQALPLDTFRQLEAGDILFIDSAHVAKMASDVNYLIFEVLPVLRPGVLIHIHDIFYPFEYPPNWILNENRSWNEAYLVRAFLQFNRNFEIVFFNDFAFRRFAPEIQRRTPLFLKNSGGSLWLRRMTEHHETLFENGLAAAEGEPQASAKGTASSQRP